MKDVVHSIGYRRLPGGRARRWAPWPIARTALALAFRKRSAKVAGALCAFVAFVHAVTLVGQVLVGRIAEDMGEGGPGAFAGEMVVRAVGQVHETLSTFVGVQLYATAILLAVVGAGLVADDRRTRAFELYFSRPLSGRDYVVGKLLVAAAVPVATIVVPFVLLFALAVGIAPHGLADALWPLFLPGLLAAVLAAAVLAGTIVGASAIGERARTVGVAYVLGLVVLGALADGLSETGHRWAGYLGPLRDVQTVSDALLRVMSTSMLTEFLSLRERTNDSAWISAAVLVALTVAGVLALVSKLFGTVRALDEIDLEIGAGVTGLLGPNGSGKSTLLKLVSGQLAPDTGTIRVRGLDPFADPRCMMGLGLCPEHDRFYEELTGERFVAALARLHGYTAAEATTRARRALARVGMERFAGKPLRAMSRGMRQRVKIAQAIAHDPDVVLLDEPLTGTDPVGRADLIALVVELGAHGRCVVVSSHVLHEVEAMTPSVVLVRFGRLRAQGNIRRLRALLADRPYRVRIEVGDQDASVGQAARTLAARLVAVPTVTAIAIVDARTLELTTTDLDTACLEVPRLAAELGLGLERLSSPDADLESLYRYLVA